MSAASFISDKTALFRAAVNYQLLSVTESPKLPTAYPTSETRVQKTAYPISGTRVQKTLSEASTVARTTLSVMKIVEKEAGDSGKVSKSPAYPLAKKAVEAVDRDQKDW